MLRINREVLAYYSVPFCPFQISFTRKVRWTGPPVNLRENSTLDDDDYDDDDDDDYYDDDVDDDDLWMIDQWQFVLGFYINQFTRC